MDEDDDDEEDITPSFTRKVQICCTTKEKLILSFYWTKMAKPNDEVLLVHVLRESKTDDELNQEFLTRLFREFNKESKLQGIKCRQIFPVGKPGESICEVASQFQPHCIIIGSSGRRKPQKNTNKSVSRYILHNGTSPVLMVPLVKGNFHEGFTTVAAVAQAALMLGSLSTESTLWNERSPRGGSCFPQRRLQKQKRGKGNRVVYARHLKMMKIYSESVQSVSMYSNCVSLNHTEKKD